MSLLVVGTLAYDTIETVAERRVEVLGGSATYVSLGASRFAPVSVVGVVGDDFRKTDIELLRKAGVDTSGIEVARGETFRWSGRYEGDWNKRVTLAQFRAASRRLRDAGIALRAFVLVQPPFLGADEAYTWACRSIDFAFDCGAAVVALIPTRSGNGALEALAQAGQFQPPGLDLLEACLIYGLRSGRGRVLADVWDAGRFEAGAGGVAEKVRRLRRMNLRQRVEETPVHHAPEQAFHEGGC